MADRRSSSPTNRLILPGTLEFSATLGTIPPNLEGKTLNGDNLALVADQWGMLRWVDEQELADYLWGGEYDEAIEDEDFL